MQIVDEFYTENDNKYVNISFTRTDPISAVIPLEYNVTKTMPVLAKASEYYIGIEKFTIPLQALPIFIMPIIQNQGNPDLSPMKIGIRTALGVDSLSNVIYEPQNDFTAPVQNNPNNQIITEYYFGYSYDQMIQMINTALATAFTLSMVAGPAPYFVYNPETQLISLIVSAVFNTLPGPLIIFNYPLTQFIDGFDVTGLTMGFDINSLLYYNVYGLVNESFGYVPFGQAPPAPLAYPAMAAPNLYKITQNYEGLAPWNPVRKLLFLTTGLPITYEIVPSGNSSQDNSGVYSSLNIITDFDPQVQRAGDSRSISYFAAQGYGGVRLTDMTTNTPLYKIDVKVYWQDIQNNIYPLVIPAYSIANIKIGFLRKNLYKNS